MKEVFYVAHPVSGDVAGNVANVIRWIHWLDLERALTGLHRAVGGRGPGVPRGGHQPGVL